MYEMAMSNHFMNKAVEKGVELEKLKSEADKPSMGLSGLLTIAGVSPSKMAIALKAESDIKRAINSFLLLGSTSNEE
jgi:hypothetical protein